MTIAIYVAVHYNYIRIVEYKYLREPKFGCFPIGVAHDCQEIGYGAGCIGNPK